MSTRELPFPGQVMLKDVEFDSYSNMSHLSYTTDVAEAEVITSQIEGSDKHKLIVDIDLPAYIVPSSTPGHGHLYVDKELEWRDLLSVLYALADAGIVERRYAEACEDQGMTCVRAPWIKKQGGTD